MQREPKFIVAFAAGLITLGLFSVAQVAEAQVSEQVKPRILLVVDISGSMASNVNGNVAESCSGGFSRFDHAKCAIQRLVEVNGDIDFALSQFRKNAISGDCSTGCTDDTAQCYADNTMNSMSSICNPNGSVDCEPCFLDASDCTLEMNSPDQFQLLVPFTDTSATDIGAWVDFSCGGASSTCTLDPSGNPELTLGGWTPIGGALRGAKRFLQGNDPIYDEGTALDLETYYGVDPSTPIALDPFALVDGAQCRPYIVITLTDGEETCEQFSGTTGAAASLLVTPVDNGTGPFNYRVETRPIGFGFSAPAPTDDCTVASPSLACQIEAIANAGGAAGDGLSDGSTGTGLEGLYAANEDELFSAFNVIIADSIKVEVCNGVDDDCDGEIDEGYDVGDVCDDGEIGVCLDQGTIVCDIPSGLSMCNVVDVINSSNEPPEICNGITDDCDVAIDEGLNCVAGCTPAQLTCSSPTDDCCDGFDNDCDGATDEDAVTGQECGSTDVGTCEFGVTTCAAGQVTCNGEIGPATELCNGIDDDCDGEADNEAICPGDTSCVEGGCRVPCTVGEFPCSFGFTCVTDFCVPDPCTNCAAELSCVDNECVDLCVDVSCDAEDRCIDGICYDCTVFGCGAEEVCFSGVCQVDSCETLNCEGENCIDGNCIPSCDSSECQPGQLCNSQGVCETNACAGVDCGLGDICVDGECLADPCAQGACRTGEVCVQGACEADRCLLANCADDQVCDRLLDGTPVCVPINPRGPIEFVTAGGGGGCQLSSGNQQGSTAVLLLFMLLPMLFWGGRRRRQ